VEKYRNPRGTEGCFSYIVEVSLICGGNHRPAASTWHTLSHVVFYRGDKNKIFDVLLYTVSETRTNLQDSTMSNRPPRGHARPETTRETSFTNSPEKNRFTFDPMENLHLWTMWRIGNTEKIVNFTKLKTSNTGEQSDLQHGVFSGVPSGSPTLLVPPLAGNIKVTGTTGQKATQMMHLTRADPPSKLKAGQYIYYGLPRVVLKEGSPSPSPRY
jgi:hypothetical protein